MVGAIISSFHCSLSSRQVLLRDAIRPRRAATPIAARRNRNSREDETTRGPDSRGAGPSYVVSVLLCALPSRSLSFSSARLSRPFRWLGDDSGFGFCCLCGPPVVKIVSCTGWAAVAALENYPKRWAVRSGRRGNRNQLVVCELDGIILV